MGLLQQKQLADKGYINLLYNKLLKRYQSGCMITESQTQIIESQLLKLRSMAPPENYHEVVHRIFDKKLRSYLSLETKEEVLQHCQQLLITKTIDYMNITNQLQSNQLKSLNLINKSILDKDSTIASLKETVQTLKTQTNQQKQLILTQSKAIEESNRIIGEERVQKIGELSKYEQIIREQQRSISRLKSEHILTKSNLEAKIKELEYDLGAKITQLKHLSVTSREEISALKGEKEKNGLDLNRKLREMKHDHDDVVAELGKDKKYLQDLLELKDDDIKKKIRSKYQLSVQLAVTVDGQKQKLEEKKSKQKDKEKERERNKREETSIRSRSKSYRSKPGKSVTFDHDELPDKKTIQKQFILKDYGIQCDLLQNLPTLLDTESQTVFQQPQSQSLSDLQLRYRDYVDQKYKFEYHQRFKRVKEDLKESMKMEILDCLRQAQEKMGHLKLASIAMMEVQSSKLLELQEIYANRPSREEDLLYIQALVGEIELLKGKCFKANTNADNAYIALQEYHVQLQNYKQNVPINIVGNIPPKINKKKSLRLQLERKPSIRNIRMSSTCSNYLQRNHLSDSNCVTREVMLTECDSQMMSPAFKKYKKRPSTGVASSNFRRKSVL